MRRTAYIAALFVLLMGTIAAFVRTNRPSSTPESQPAPVVVKDGDARKTETTELPSAVPDASDVKRLVTSSGNDRKEVQEDARRDDEAKSRRLIRDGAKHDVDRFYSLLVEDVGLSESERAALLAFLIEDQLARTSTPYVTAKARDPRERSKQIAAIIGDIKLERFLALERYVRAYGDVHDIGSVLERNGVPFTKVQQENLLGLLKTTRDAYGTTPSPSGQGLSIEYLEKRLAEENEYARHLLELAASVLSSEQLRHVFDYYQARSERFASSIEEQKQMRAKDPTFDGFVFYPAN